MARETWFSDVIRAIAGSGADYVVVGGLASIAYGQVRLTQDVDLIVELSPDNARRAVAALEAIDYSPRVPVPAAHFADAEHRRRWREEKNMVVFSMIHPEGARPTVDLFVAYPMPWDQIAAGAEVRSVSGVSARVCSLDHLIAMKESAGRAKDHVDLERLREIREQRDND